MNVTVKVVVFKHPEPTRWGIYCSYCPELEYFFGRGDSVEKVIDNVKENLIEELKNRNAYRNLKIMNWEISENSIIPPKFTDEEAINLAEESYELHIEHPQIIEINVEVPPAQKLW